MSSIEIMSLSKTFKGRKGTTIDALRDLSLTIHQGEVFGFLGPNGAGKTTTIKILMGLIAPTAGRIRIMGEDARSHDSRVRAGYLPENPSFYDYLSAEEYLKFVGRIFGMSGADLDEKTSGILKLMDLWDARKRRIRAYSKGMVQRLGLAQVLIHDPDVYILDEPMSGLDPLGRSLVKDMILQLKERGKSVFFSTHITADVETVCDRVGIILKGSLQSVDTVSSIMREGIVGYHLHIRDKNSSEDTEVYITKDRLSGFIQETQDRAQEISLIEPKRKNLEDFFLDMVREQK